MSIVQRIDGSIVEHVKITHVKEVGDEGSRSGFGHIGDETFPVYKSIVDGFTEVWQEQLSDEAWERVKQNAKEFNEASMKSLDRFLEK